MSPSMIVLALTIGAAPVLARTSGTAATIEVRGFVPASCRITAASAATCNTAVVRRIALSREGGPAVVFVRPLF